MPTYAVPLTFTPPDYPDLVSLHIYEGSSQAGAFNEIEVVSDIGTFPEYITQHITVHASDPQNWFTIRWKNSDGAFSSFGQALQGQTTTLVGQVVKRARERNRHMNPNVLAQEAEAAIQYVLGENVDPYDTTLTLPYRKLNGLTYLTMANTMIATDLGGSGNLSSAGIGLVQFKMQQSTKSSATEIAALIDLANVQLGIATSVILQIENVWCRRPWVRTSDFRSVGLCGVLEA